MVERAGQRDGVQKKVEIDGGGRWISTDVGRWTQFRGRGVVEDCWVGAEFRGRGGVEVGDGGR